MTGLRWNSFRLSVVPSKSVSAKPFSAGNKEIQLYAEQQRCRVLVFCLSILKSITRSLSEDKSLR